MNHYPNLSLDEYSGCGPRPPVPGRESRRQEMTEKGREVACRWAESLTTLLEDKEGVKLLSEFAKSEGGSHDDRLKFYFACEGLKHPTDPNLITQTIHAIYRRFIRKTELRTIVPEDIRRTIKDNLHNGGFLPANIFDKVQKEVLQIIEDQTYGQFLQSDMYIGYVNRGGHQQSSATNSSSGSSGEPSNLISRSDTLPTLYEDTELHNYDSNFGLSSSCGASESNAASSIPLALTRDALMATQHRRLEMRPTRSQNSMLYNVHTSYNPVSCRDSELHSVSSGQTDSDTMSLAGNLASGERRESRRQASMSRRMLEGNLREPQNWETDEFPLIPRTQRTNVRAKATPVAPEEFLSQLFPKLEEVLKQQERDEMFHSRMPELRTQSNPEALQSAIWDLLKDDTSDQNILDQHVSRVWSDLTPGRSPGAISPCPNPNRRPMDVSGQLATNTQSMRHSKSLPENSNRKLTNKWPSINTDSGISLMSTDTLGKYKDPYQGDRPYMRSGYMAPSGSSSMVYPDPKLRLQEDETRRTKRLPPPPPPIYQQQQQLQPPLPAKPQQHQLPAQQNIIGSLQRPALPPQQLESFTIVVYSFCDEDVPYRIKIPGTSPPTLRQFKENLPKKGNYRFFFKTRCDDLDNPIIQEEIVNDSEVLPLFEGKVMGTVKSSE